MNVKLPEAPATYDQGDQTVMRRNLLESLAGAFGKFSDVDLANGERLVLKSPNGKRWSITVNNGGVISATAL